LNSIIFRFKNFRKFTVVFEEYCHTNRITNIIDLSDRLIAVIYKSGYNERFALNQFYVIFDKNTREKLLSEKGAHITITSLADGKFIKIKDEKIALMGKSLEILKRGNCQKYQIIEVLNEKMCIL
jgi:hypothetical protein